MPEAVANEREAKEFKLLWASILGRAKHERADEPSALQYEVCLLAGARWHELIKFAGMKFIALLAGLFGLMGLARGDDWPQWLGPKRDGIWRETGILKRFPADGPRVRWRTDIGAGYAGPAVAAGKVYVTDRL